MFMTQLTVAATVMFEVVNVHHSSCRWQSFKSGPCPQNQSTPVGTSWEKYDLRDVLCPLGIP